MKDTARLQRFLIGFQSSILPRISESNSGLVYMISQSLAEDPLVRDVAHLKTGSGYSVGEFMGVVVRTFPDFKAEDYRA